MAPDDRVVYSYQYRPTYLHSVLWNPLRSITVCNTHNRTSCCDYGGMYKCDLCSVLVCESCPSCEETAVHGP